MWLEDQLREFKHKLCDTARLDPVFTKIRLSEHKVVKTLISCTKPWFFTCVELQKPNRLDPSQTEFRYVCKVEMGSDLFTVEISTGPNKSNPKLQTFLPTSNWPSKKRASFHFVLLFVSFLASEFGKVVFVRQKFQKFLA